MNTSRRLFKRLWVEAPPAAEPAASVPLSGRSPRMDPGASTGVARMAWRKFVSQKAG